MERNGLRTVLMAPKAAVRMQVADVMHTHRCLAHLQYGISLFLHLGQVSITQITYLRAYLRPVQSTLPLTRPYLSRPGQHNGEHRHGLRSDPCANPPIAGDLPWVADPPF